MSAHREGRARPASGCRVKTSRRTRTEEDSAFEHERKVPRIDEALAFGPGTGIGPTCIAEQELPDRKLGRGAVRQPAPEGMPSKLRATRLARIQREDEQLAERSSHYWQCLRLHHLPPVPSNDGKDTLPLSGNTTAASIRARCGPRHAISHGPKRSALRDVKCLLAAAK